MDLSVVIIASNWSPDLVRTLESVKDLGQELLLYDSGNLDNVRAEATRYGARVVRGEWRNFGETRKRAYLLARHDWILAIDSDEILDDSLRQAIARVDLSNERIAYRLRFRNFVGEKELKHGEWGHEAHIRLANRNAVTLETKIVHERVVLNPGVRVKTLEGHVLHYTAKTVEEYSRKMLLYAKLSSDKYQQEGRWASGPRLLIAPLFSFIRNYGVRLGFLDGWEGFLCAGMSSWYTFLKYAYLRERKKDAQRASSSAARASTSTSAPG
jgi:glycosyltransferase involved in cell wall biosynthesis